jgi:hypothetical protein
MVDEMVNHLQTQYLQYCDPQIPHQRMALGLAAVIEWRCWSIFWLRTPKQYREAVVSPEIRQTYVWCHPLKQITPFRVWIQKLMNVFRVLAKSVSLVESLNMMSDDRDAQKFQWHIGGHACFQSIMHIVSELETPEFQAPNHRSLRSRALGVLKRTMDTRGREVTPMWNVINRIISNCLAKNAPATFPLTPFQAIFPPNAAIPGIGSTTTAPPPTVARSSSVSGDSAIATPLPDLSEVGSLDMQDPTLAFDWVRESNALMRRSALTVLTRDSGILTPQILAPIENYIFVSYALFSSCLSHALWKVGTCHKGLCVGF